jgi:exodeoxyribonuclease VII small subunit
LGHTPRPGQAEEYDKITVYYMKKETYSQAIERLEEIVRQIDNNELEIDALSEKIKEANEIIAFCSAKLTKADAEVEKLLKEKQQSEG